MKPIIKKKNSNINNIENSSNKEILKVLYPLSMQTIGTYN